MSTADFEERLRDLIGSDQHLTPLLDRAEQLAKERGVFARRRGYEGYYTIAAALELAIAVWDVENRRG